MRHVIVTGKQYTRLREFGLRNIPDEDWGYKIDSEEFFSYFYYRVMDQGIAIDNWHPVHPDVIESYLDNGGSVFEWDPKIYNDFIEYYDSSQTEE